MNVATSPTCADCGRTFRPHGHHPNSPICLTCRRAKRQRKCLSCGTIVTRWATPAQGRSPRDARPLFARRFEAIVCPACDAAGSSLVLPEDWQATV